MKKRRALRIALVIAAVAVVLLCGLYAFGKSYFTDARVYEINWGIELPGGMTELYSTGSEASFGGDGFSYTVYEYDGGSSAFNDSLSAGPDAGAESAVGEILDALAVPESERPDFTSDYTWRSGSRPVDERDELYIICQDGKLYIAESML